MSQAASLWIAYLQDDIHTFKQLLSGAYSENKKSRKPLGTTIASSPTPSVSTQSPGDTLSTSPILSARIRKTSGKGSTFSFAKGNSPPLTKADVNSRDRQGVTIFHQVASSSRESAVSFALALLESPLLDLYVQDVESGWTALHRALYVGNVTIARAIMTRNAHDLANPSQKGGSFTPAVPIFKIKDKEGNGPFDVALATVRERTLHDEEELAGAHFSDSESLGDIESEKESLVSKHITPLVSLGGEELFVWGSNKNISLGLGNEDDRHFPERVNLKRPDHLLFRFHREYQKERLERLALVNGANAASSVTNIDLKSTKALPTFIQHKPIKVQNIFLSKMHSAVLTTDPESNLYVAGFGPGGRLGTGDEATRFSFACIEGGGLRGKKIIDLGLGHNHTLAVSSTGGVWSWGNNNHGQLGYAVTSRSRDDDPVQLIPRQIFGPLKKEMIIGAAASRLHSVVYSSEALYAFGRNVGQLGLVDADARSLELQPIPRRVAASLFSSPIKAVTAIEKATICLLENSEVWVFANFGYAKAVFPLDGFQNFFVGRTSNMATSYERTSNYIVKVAAGGDTICALSKTGDVFTIGVSPKPEPVQVAVSTTTPAKIRGALSQPQRIYCSNKKHMAVVDVDMSQDGSIIICTKAGSIWIREKRKNATEHAASFETGYRPKGWKFRRIPSLTGVTAVRSNAFGAFAAVRLDPDVTKRQILIDKRTLQEDMAPLLCIRGLVKPDMDEEEFLEPARLWAPTKRLSQLELLKRIILKSKDIETEIQELLYGLDSDASFDMEMTTCRSDFSIPVHQSVLAARCKPIRDALYWYHKAGSGSISDSILVKSGTDSRPKLVFSNADFMSVLNLVVYFYQDTVVDCWSRARSSSKRDLYLRQIRTEVMNFASQLKLPILERAARLMIEPVDSMHLDFELALSDPTYTEGGDLLVQLMYTEVRVHSVIMIQRCPFFKALFQGRAAGMWLDERKAALADPEDMLKVDLKHVDPAIFRIVLQHIYSDAEELFDDIRSSDLDEYLDVILDVLAVANELMLDRLSQICQKVLGKYVNVRNVCQLLNAVAPCSVTEFKDACLEYLCLNLEGMLENHLLDELDDDMMEELDIAVRDNQASFSPFTRMKVAELRLFESHPELAEMIDEERQLKIRDFAFRAQQAEGDRRPSASKGRASSAHDLTILAQSPTSAPRSAPPWKSEVPVSKKAISARPAFKKTANTDESVFALEMGGESPTAAGKWTIPKYHSSPKPSPAPQVTSSPLHLASDHTRSRPALCDASSSLDAAAFPQLDNSKPIARSPSGQQGPIRPASQTKPATSAPSSPEIVPFTPSIKAKMSQRERKKARQPPLPPPATVTSSPSPGPSQPKPHAWTTPTPNPSPVIISSSYPPPPSSSTAQPKATSSPQPKPPPPLHQQQAPPPQTPPGPTDLSSIIAHETALAEARLAYAETRPLQDIQAEQAFQTWWDGESRRVQDEAERRQRADAKREKKAAGRGGKRRPSMKKAEDESGANEKTETNGRVVGEEKVGGGEKGASSGARGGGRGGGSRSRGKGGREPTTPAADEKGENAGRAASEGKSPSQSRHSHYHNSSGRGRGSRGRGGTARGGGGGGKAPAAARTGGEQ